MEHMVWNDVLAQMAQDWAELCQWKHGNVNNNYNHGFSDTGQNLFAGTGSPNYETAITDWYNEIDYYNYETRGCSKTPCGHYTQVVWHNSYAVGCAKHTCPTMQGVSYTNAVYIVCNYGPGGNVNGEKPYKKGSPCTECGSGKFWCYEDSLCKSDCSGSTCTCKASACQNCADVTSDCTCQCQKGNGGPTCAVPCEDQDPWCGGNGWWPNHCHMDDVSFYCWKMCGSCVAADPSESGCLATTTTSTTTAPPTTTSTTTTSTTTAPPTTTSTTTTSTTSAPPTTTSTTTDPPTTTSTPLDCTDYCEHGGTPSVSSANECTCDCTDDWQGDKCQHSREEASLGVSFLVGAPLSMWEMIWSWLQPLIVDAANDFCNDNPNTCCGTTTSKQYSDLTYTDDSGVRVAEGFPLTVSRSFFRVTILVYPAQNNALCIAAQSDSTQRKKRQLDGFDASAAIPQEVLLEVVESIQDTISAELDDCCNATLEEISRPEIEPLETTTLATTTTSVDSDSDFPLLPTILGSILGFIALISLVLAVICACFQTRKATVKHDYMKWNQQPHLENRSRYKPERSLSYIASVPPTVPHWDKPVTSVNGSPDPIRSYAHQQASVPSPQPKGIVPPLYRSRPPSYYSTSRVPSYYSVSRVPTLLGRQQSHESGSSGHSMHGQSVYMK